MQKQPLIRSEKHRKFIASLPCVITGARDVQCAHIRKGSNAGLGRKPCDSRTVPLSVEQHRLQGEIGELKYWEPYGGYERAVVLANKLYEVSGDRAAAMGIIAGWGKWPTTS